jgi:hypothetical protein
VDNDPATAPSSAPAPPSVVAQLLATEHWSLLATRGTMWSEVMSRITILLTVLTGSLVILGLVAQAGGFGTTFQVLAIGLAGAGLILGTLTSVRVFLASDEDAGLILAMNRLRAAYAELAPGIEDQFLTSTRSDEAGLMQTYSLGVRRHPLVHVVGSTNFFVGTVNTLVAGALAALISATMDAATGVVVLVGVLAAVAYFTLFLYAAFRSFGARRRALPPPENGPPALGFPSADGALVGSRGHPKRTTSRSGLSRSAPASSSLSCSPHVLSTTPPSSS